MFYLLAILVIPFAAASWFILPTHTNHTSAEKKSLDWPGVVSLTVGLILFVFAISEGSNGGESYAVCSSKFFGLNDIQNRMGNGEGHRASYTIDLHVCRLPHH